jgi:Flp pilus assembly protein TadG
MSTRIMRRVFSAARRWSLWRSQDGVISIETALVGSVMAIMSLGVVDFSLAYTRMSEMSNAVRAGVQFALVRRPSIGPSAAAQESIISLETIRQAVINSSRYITVDPGPEMLQASVFCQFPDGSSVTCVSDPGVALACTDRRTFLQITLRDNYTPIFNYPLVPEQIPLMATNSVRLN